VLDRSAPQKHVWRANIILATADGCGTAEIMRRSGKSKPVVWALLRLSKRTPGSEMRSCGYRQPARRIQGQKFGAENQNGHPRVGCWPMMRTDFLPNNRFTYG
jgi:hypothetical protein